MTSSSFIRYCTLATRGLLVTIMRIVAYNHRATVAEASRFYFDGTGSAKKTILFRELANKYFQACCKEYMITHQQIVNGTKQISDLNEDNHDEYVYCIMQKIMSEENGYKHLNCIFDGAMIFCTLQFEYVLSSLRNGLLIGCSNSSRGGHFHDTETAILRHVFDQQLSVANEKIAGLRTNDDPYKSGRLKCEENNTCELDFRNELQRQEQLAIQIRQEP